MSSLKGKKIIRNNFHNNNPIITPTLNVKDSNKYLINIINKKNLLISRFGGAEGNNSINFLKKKSYTSLHTLDNNAGIYINNIKDIDVYGKLYSECVIQSDSILCFPILKDSLSNTQNFYINNFKKLPLHNGVIEPWEMLARNIKPWTHYLLGKKVLIISHFTESMKKQMDFKFFHNSHIFLPGQVFVYYKTFQTSGGNHPHRNWIETFEIMCRDISKLDFDIALVSCGGYGLPICHYIHNVLKKGSIYVGGILQIYFGIIGRRWLREEKYHIIRNTYNSNKKDWVSPSDEEKPKNFNKVEDACYW